MYKRLISTAAVFGAASLAPPNALYAQENTPRCMVRSELIEQLDTRYSERLIGGGLQTSQSLIEVWGSTGSGSFTVLITNTSGISCIVAAGDHWNTAPPEKPGSDS